MISAENERHRAIIAASLEGVVVLDNQGNILEVNNAACTLLGRTREELVGLAASALAADCGAIRIAELTAEDLQGDSHSFRTEIARPDGTSLHVDVLAQVLPGGERFAMLRDSTLLVEIERLQHDARAVAERRARAGAALSSAAAAVLRCQDFTDAAQTIYGSCKGFIGAEAGYVSLTNDDEGDTVLLVDAGGMGASIAVPFVMPLDPLRDRAAETGKVVCVNDLPSSEFASLLPSDHPPLRNVLTAPLILKERIVGMMTLVNKPGAFDGTDIEFAAAFGEIMAASLASIRLHRDLESAARMQRLVFEGARDAVFWADGDTGLILDCNRAAEELIGVERELLLGQRQTILHPPEEAEAYAALFARALAGQHSGLIEAVIVRADGTHVHVEISTSVVEMSGRRIMQGLFRDVTEAKAAHDELERQGRRLSELTAEILRTQDRERRSAALELHDGVGQSLAASKMIAQQLAERCETPDEQQVAHLLRLLDDAIAHVRGLTNELSPPVLYELGLSAALSWLCDSYADRFGLQCDLLVDPALSGLKGGSANVAFRAARELLMNVERHAQVDEVRMSATLLDDTIVLRVEDQGSGFDPRVMSVDESNRFGLFSIREEVRLSGGTIEIDSAPGQGARIDVRIPFETPDNGSDGSH